MTTPERDDTLACCGEALLKLAAERPWAEITLRGVAESAGVPLADLYAAAPSRFALLAEVSQAFDRRALAAETAGEDDPHDRLFEAVMARIEAMEPHRAALLAIAKATGPLPLLPHLPFTARALLEAAGVTATPPRVLALAAAWARIVQVWRADEGALNRTMAEVDRRLKDVRGALRRIGAGF